MKSFFFTILLITITTHAHYAQLSDLARLEYTYFPQRESDNSFQRLRALVRMPLKLNKKGAYLVPGFEYRNINFDYEDRPIPSFSVTNLDNFNSYDLTLGYTYKIKEDLRFAAKSGVLIASNFEDRNITNDDILYSGGVFLIKDKTEEGQAKKPWRLIVGLQYSTKAGRPFPLPIVNYYKKIHPKWAYGLGVPKTNIKYFPSPTNQLQAFATLDGFFANIQNNKTIPNRNGIGTETAASISMTIALAGLGYEHCFTEHLIFYVYAGFTIINDIRLRDEDQEDVFTINDKNSLYMRGGLKFKI
ncbi:DUF6268 family outer membrane beta-barrel protein [Aquimarina agarilytica]|uniref:DUF6268 family outer membrane beta-barrel protein n=1 Tax=Aquimarina agarilytica TaxID=1087449 RepID=UPI000287B258|nr:DUF6268 family outer membrane beta-barrel protein [Aquimarina agarilytica]